MKEIKDFVIDKWILDNKPRCHTTLHGSYAAALSLNDLRNLAPSSASPIDPDLQLTYGVVQGSIKLRQRIAELHSSDAVKLTAENVVITPGSILANYLVLSTILERGDHAICQYPTYAQLYSLPKHAGVDVALWKQDDGKEWALDVDELEGMIRPNTKAIIINNPNNPTGSVIAKEKLQRIVAIAREHNITLFSDEVFHPMFHTDEPPPPPVVSLNYANSVSTGSLSKAFALPGIRVGWVVSPDLKFLEKISTARDYTTISVSLLDDGVAAFALSEPIYSKLLQRNAGLCRQSIPLLNAFVQRNHQRCRWVPSQGAGTAFVQMLKKDGSPVDDVDFASRFADEEGILVVPGRHCFDEDGRGDFEGYVRITLGEPDVLEPCLKRLEAFFQKY